MESVLQNEKIYKIYMGWYGNIFKILHSKSK